MDDFNELINYLSREKINRVVLNSDEDHGLIVLRQIFVQSNETVRIFAGALYKSIGDDPAYIESISSFIERGGAVKILLNNFDQERAKESNLFKRLAFYVSEKKPIHIRCTTSKPFLKNDTEQKPIHFTIGDETSYRIETDIEKRTAYFNFNNPEFAKSYVKFFDDVFAKASDIDIKSIFNLD